MTDLLDKWEKLLIDGESASKRKAMSLEGGLSGRIRRTTGTPIIFDIDFYEKQKQIQDSLCKELSQLSDLIRSEPDIMDGYRWTRKDFIELYFSHYRLVIDKIKELI